MRFCFCCVCVCHACVRIRARVYLPAAALASHTLCALLSPSRSPLSYEDACKRTVPAPYAPHTDTQAICKLHGTPAGAPISEILIAVDAEYKKLLSEGNSERADYVQGLHGTSIQPSLAPYRHHFTRTAITSLVPTSLHSYRHGHGHAYTLY